MDLVKCAICDNISFVKKHYFEKYNDEFFLHRIATVCDKCGEPLQWMTQDKVLGGF